MEKEDLTPALFITTELQKFEIKEEDLTALASKYAALEIKGVQDKEGYKLVYEARQELKKKRVEIANKGKKLRASANAFSRAVIAREQELISLIDPTEKALLAKEDAIDAEKKRLREEEKKLEEQRIQVMIDKLAVVNYAVDFSQLRAVTDEQFELLLSEATAQHTKKLEEEAEAKRLESERLEKERLEREAENKRLEEVAKQQAEAQRKLEEEQRKFRQEQDKIRQENEARERRIREENERIENEKKAIQKQKFDARYKACTDIGLTWDLGEEAFHFVAHLSKQNVYFPYSDLISWTDQQFEEKLSLAKSVIDAEKDALAKQKQTYELGLLRRDKIIALGGDVKNDRASIFDLGEMDSTAWDTVYAQGILNKQAKDKAEEEERQRQATDTQRFGELSDIIQLQLLDHSIWNHFESEKATVRARAIRDLLDKAKVMCNG